MSQELISLVLAWFLVGVFVPALYHKLSNAMRFIPALAAYRVLPVGLARWAASMVMAAEVATVAGLLLAPRSGFALAASLLAVYMLAMVINLLRGRVWIDCGCGDEPVHLSWALVARNVVLTGLAVFGFGLSAGPVMDLALQCLGLALSLVGVAGYFAIEQLFANHTRYQRYWLGENI